MKKFSVARKTKLECGSPWWVYDAGDNINMLLTESEYDLVGPVVVKLEPGDYFQTSDLMVACLS